MILIIGIITLIGHCFSDSQIPLKMFDIIRYEDSISVKFFIFETFKTIGSVIGKNSEIAKHKNGFEVKYSRQQENFNFFVKFIQINGKKTFSTDIELSVYTDTIFYPFLKPHYSWFIYLYDRFIVKKKLNPLNILKPLQILGTSVPYYSCIAQINSFGEYYNYKCVSMVVFDPINSIIHTHLTANEIEVIWILKKQNDNITNYYVHLITDSECRAVFIQLPKMKQKQYLHSNCKLEQHLHWQKLTYLKLKNLNPYTDYKLLIIPAVDNDAQEISALRFTTDTGDYNDECFYDCKLYKKFQGMLGQTTDRCSYWKNNFAKSKSKINLRPISNWCNIFDYKEGKFFKSGPPKCYSSMTNKPIDCNFDKCKFRSTTCNYASVKNKKGYLEITVSLPTVGEKIFILVAIFQDYNFKCKSARIYYPSLKQTKFPKIERFLGDCKDSVVYILTSQFTLHLLNIYGNVNYLILIPFNKNLNSLYIRKFKTYGDHPFNCFVDCASGLYKGIRQTDRNANRCDKWTESRPLERGRLCTMKNALFGQPWCLVGSVRKNCDIPKCPIWNTIPTCPDLIDMKVIGTNLHGSFRRNSLKTDWVIVMLYLDGITCITSYFQYSGQPPSTDYNTAKYTNACKNKKQLVYPQSTFKFSSLLHGVVYDVYALTYNPNKQEFSGVRNYSFKINSKENCYADCISRGTYHGIRSDSAGFRCFDWKDTLFPDYAKSNWCTTNHSYDGYPWCFNKFGYSLCNINQCGDLVTSHQCDRLHFNISISSISVIWNEGAYTKQPKYEVVLLYNEKGKCVSGSYKEPGYDKYGLDEYLSCKQFGLKPKTTVQFVFSYLMNFRPHYLYAFTITNDFRVYQKMYVPVSNEGLSKDCFLECLMPKRPYNGVRSFAETGRTCIHWKYLTTSVKAKSNWCNQMTRSWCVTFIAKEYCDIPECNKLTKYSLCVDVFDVKTEDNFLSIKWKDPKSKNTPIIGYIILLYDKNHVCLYGKVTSDKLMLIETFAKRFLISCRSFHMDIKINHYFKRNVSFANFNSYYVIILPLLGQSDLGVGRNVPFNGPNPTDRNVCNQDCIGDTPYKGIRSAAEGTYECLNWASTRYSNFAKSNWCIGESKSKDAWCVTTFGPKKCVIPRCDTLPVMKCVDIKTTRSNSKGIYVQWRPITKGNVNHYIVILHNIDGDCIDSVLYGDFGTNPLPEYFVNLFIGCEQRRQVFRITNIYEFNQLTYGGMFNLFIFPIYDKSSIGVYRNVTFFFKNSGSNKCTLDCATHNTYSGIRSVDKVGNKCLKWTNTKYRNEITQLGNACTFQTSQTNAAWCVTKMGNRNCDIPHCDELKKTSISLCTDVYNLLSTYTSVQGSVRRPTDTKLKGHIVLLHNKDSMCIDAVLHGNIKESNLGNNIKTLYKACANIRFKKAKLIKFAFSNLAFDETHTVRIIPLTNNKAGKINKIIFPRKLNRDYKSCFVDCSSTGSYKGIRSADWRGSVCEKWSKNYKQLNSNWCTAKNAMDGNPWCITLSGSSRCNVPPCSTIKRSSNCVEVKNLKVNASGIKGSWSKPKGRSNIMGYLVLLHDEKGDCLDSLLSLKIGKYLQPNALNEFYLSCSRYSNNTGSINTYHFTHFKYGKNYTVYIVPILDKNGNVGLIRKVIHHVKYVKKKHPSKNNIFSLVVIICVVIVIILFAVGITVYFKMCRKTKKKRKSYNRDTASSAPKNISTLSSISTARFINAYDSSKSTMASLY